MADLVRGGVLPFQVSKGMVIGPRVGELMNREAVEVQRIVPTSRSVLR